SIITDPRVVDRIHLESQACRARDPSAPPHATAGRRPFLAMISKRRPLEFSPQLAPKLERSLSVRVGRPMSHASAGEGEYFREGLHGTCFQPAEPVSLPSKILTSAGLSRLSVALELECP